VQTTTLGPLTVSRLALGAMLMGGKTPPDEAERILDRYLASGGNFIDTADVYEDGGSERVLAPWLARHRPEVVVATKVRFEVSDPGGAGLAPDRIRAACDASLRRLGTDVIDLYQLHAPDPVVPVEESLEALEALVRAGKVRALGISNFPAWLTAWSVAVQDREGWTPFVALQAQYSLVERSIEVELLPFCRAAGSACCPGARSAPASCLAATSGARRRRRGAASRKRRGTTKRPTNGAPWSATFGSSTPPPRSPRHTERRSRRSRSPGCSAPTA
jgi:aryl-alcohol dehydrogenase-like predicted oxidoreductase